MLMGTKLRIAIDCRIGEARQGIGTAVLALAKALSESQAGSQEYTFIVREDMREWLTPYIYGPCKLVGIPASRISVLKTVLRQIAPLKFFWNKVRRETADVPVSDGYVESHRFDLVHFPTPVAYLTELPSIYQPHDLQHLHYPEFFSKGEFERRERQYRAFCGGASFVCVHADWTKDDLIKNYGTTPDKIIVIKWGVVFEDDQNDAIDSTKLVIEKYGLPNVFFFYPAVTWQHKNHEAIIRALRILKEEHGRTPSVYLTGRTTNFRSALDRMARESGVFEQLHYLGFVAPEELKAIYRAATAMLYPSKFEGFGLPLLEAFQARLPVLSSNASVLPEIAQDGALYFDPNSPEELAMLIVTMLDDEHVRQELIEKGALVLSQYSFKSTAANFQSLYERTASR